MEQTTDNPEIIAPAAPQLAELPGYQCYDCQVCGKCCGGIFTVVLQPGEVERISEQGWEAELQGTAPFVKHGKGFRLNNREDGTCVFLDEENRCRIHAKFGLQGKPIACQLYPFKFIPAGQTVHTDLRFDCPAVASNVGRPVTEYRAELEEMLPRLVAGAAQPAPFHDRLRLEWAQLERVTAELARLMSLRELDLTARVAGCVQFSAILRHLNRQALDLSTLDQVLETIFNTVVLALAQDPLERIPPSAGTLTSFRQLLVVYAREDRRGEQVPVSKRYGQFFSMVGGQGPVPPLRPDFPEVPFSALEAPIGYPPDDVVEPLERCLRVRLESMGFFGTGFAGYSYLDGLNALLLTYPAAFWFARIYAAGKELPAPDAECVAKGVSIVNHVHGLAAVFKFPLERYHLRALGNPVILRKLAVWYGR
ncbi:MAG: YkgJ family cysteine cluster protein [Armatimonadota bacterium]